MRTLPIALLLVSAVTAAEASIYNQVVAQVRDPALLEITDAGDMQLSVFPVTRGIPARVTIELTSVDKLEGLLSVNHATSLIAAPAVTERDDGYAEYWPQHPEAIAEVIAAIDAEP